MESIQLCRICCVPDNLINIFEEEGDIPTIISYTTAIEVQATDIVTTICFHCLNLLKAYYEFKSKTNNINNIIKNIEDCNIFAPGTAVNKIEDYIRNILNRKAGEPDDFNNEVTEEDSESPEMPLPIEENDSDIDLPDESMYQVITISNDISYIEDDDLPIDCEENSYFDNEYLNDNISDNDDRVEYPFDDNELIIKTESCEITFFEEQSNVPNEPAPNSSDENENGHQISKVIVAEFDNNNSDTSESDIIIRYYEPMDNCSNELPKENLNNEIQNTNMEINDQHNNMDKEPTTNTDAEQETTPSESWLHMLNAEPSTGSTAVGFAVAIRLNQHNLILDKKLQSTPVVPVINCCDHRNATLCLDDYGGTEELDLQGSVLYLRQKDEYALTVAERVKLRRKRSPVKKCYKLSKTYNKSPTAIRKNKKHLQQPTLRNMISTLKKLNINA